VVVAVAQQLVATAEEVVVAVLVGC